MLTAQETTSTTTKTDSIQAIIKDEVKKALDESESIEIGFFSKARPKVRIFNDEDRKKCKKEKRKKCEDELDKIQQKSDSLNNLGAILDRLQKKHSYDSIKVAEIVNKLSAKELEKNDSILTKTIEEYNQKN